MAKIQRKTTFGAYKASKQVARFFGAISKVMQVIQREHYFWEFYPLTLSQRIEAWRNGFTSRDYILLDLHSNNPRDYLSYYQQAKCIYPAVNNEYKDVIENKVAFQLLTSKYVDCVPTLFGTIKEGEFHPLKENGTASELVQVIKAEEDIIAKPITGTGGKGVYHITHSYGEYQLNGDSISEKELVDLVFQLDDYMVVEYISQHAYTNKIWPESANTIRVLTVLDPSTNEFFIPSAVHRFGGVETGPTNNWSGGGVAAPINVATGELGNLLQYSTDDGLLHFDRHPDTDEPVTGKTIPDWERVRSTVLEVAELHRENPYIGWDVVVTENGPVILEGNCAPHLALQQLGGGLLKDERVRDFLNEV